jgi:hypothetical protein
MSEPRITELLEKEIYGSTYFVGDYDDDVDIASPKQYSITSGAKSVYLTIKVKYNALATIVLNTGLVIGTGGGAAAGTAITFSKRDQANTGTPLTVLRKDYVLGSSGQSAGTAIVTEMQLPIIETVIKVKLKAATIYGLVITSVADNNFGTVVFEIDED